MEHAAIARAAGAEGLRIEAAFAPGLETPGIAPGVRAIVLLGPDGPRFWPRFVTAPEMADGEAHPLDRWSERVVGALARALGARAAFPFGGPPFAPFLAWARESGVLSQAPIGPLVHPETGLWTSFRGALLFAEAVTGVPTAPAPPCATCAAEPCRSACPVDAFAGGQYDVPRCRAFLRTPEGADCMTRGCAARRACPVGQGFAPDSERAMLHMRAFRGA